MQRQLEALVLSFAKKKKGNKMGFLLEDILSKNNLIEDGTFVSTTGYFGVKIL